MRARACVYVCVYVWLKLIDFAEHTHTHTKGKPASYMYIAHSPIIHRSGLATYLLILELSMHAGFHHLLHEWGGPCKGEASSTPSPYF